MSLQITNIHRFPTFDNFHSPLVHLYKCVPSLSITFVNYIKRGMLRFLLIEDTKCKKDLKDFIKKYKQSIRAIINCGADESGVNGSKGIEHNSHKKLIINTNDSYTLLNISEIIRCEGDRNYTNIMMANERRYVVSKTLLEFDKLLYTHQFLRIHKSHLINMNYIDKYIKAGGGQIVLTDGTTLPVSIRKKEYLLRELQKL